MNWEEKLSKDLGLIATGQDFGIINADGKRLKEFIKYFKKNVAIDPWEWEELADLILESANEAILEEYITEGEIDEISYILRFHRHKFPQSWEYWIKIENEQDYPIVSIINNIDTVNSQPR